MKKAGKDKLEEKEPLCRLQELNSDFAKIKKKTTKKRQKKPIKTKTKNFHCNIYY